MSLKKCVCGRGGCGECVNYIPESGPRTEGTICKLTCRTRQIVCGGCGGVWVIQVILYHLKWDAPEGRISNQHWNPTLAEIKCPILFLQGFIL